MATGGRDQAFHEMTQILQGDPEARQGFNDQACIAVAGHVIHPFWRYWTCNISHTLVSIRLGDVRAVGYQLQMAMLAEKFDIGPERYCINYPRRRGPEFYSLLKLVMFFLPHEKMFIFPIGTRLEGSFLQEPWLSRGRALSLRPSLTFQEFNNEFFHR